MDTIPIVTDSLNMTTLIASIAIFLASVVFAVILLTLGKTMRAAFFALFLGLCHTDAHRRQQTIPQSLY